MDKLPKQLKDLVHKVVALLGDVVKEEGGKQLYNKIETIRKQMVEYRLVNQESQSEILRKLHKDLSKLNSEEKHKVAHSFTLMLEIMNTCETAYRTFRLQETRAVFNLKKQENTLVYVLTAHPTEARTTQNIDLFHRIQDVCVRILDKSGEEEYLLSIIKHNIKLAWLLPVTRHEKPQVVDEARHLFSIVLRQDIFDTLIRANRDLGTVRVRTWVGGDKDGHPGVDEKVMVACFQAARDHFEKIVMRLLRSFEIDVTYLNNEKLNSQLKHIYKLMGEINKVKKGDSLKVREVKASVRELDLIYEKAVGARSPRLRKLESIFEIFPGLVVPIEIREDSEIIGQALGKTIRPLAIERMLKTLREITANGSVRCYVQGMIISMCESHGDVKNAMELVKRSLGALSIPVIPLFETASALSDSQEIVEKMLKDKEYRDCIKKAWSNRLEVMLGYSDSSKGMGVLASRLSIARTMRNLDMLITSYGIQPIFFHGSGGSVDRGGGSLKEQTAWWPKSALELYKATIQGEMVERNFSSPEVTLSGMNKILTSFDRSKTKSGEIKIDKILDEFAAGVEKEYSTKIQEEDFFRIVEKATPYSYLNVLKLGSRPTKRSKAAVLDFRSIRAIPWVLCWTQTRILFPTWWGVGSTWNEFKKDPKKFKSLKTCFRNSNVFASFIRLLGFSLSKVDLQVFRLYLNQSDLSLELQEKAFEEFLTEYRLACNLVYTMTDGKNLLWFRPWLKESINLRSSMIHPLNVLQIIGHQTDDLDLIRKCVAGISTGMLTTG